jgi:ATP-binding cassette subfamily A (ABC1) protein 3
MAQYTKIAVKPKSWPAKLLLQIKLLLWKRYLESTKSKWELAKVLLPAWLFFTLLIVLYVNFGFFAAGGLEPLFVPLAFWVFVQRIVVQIMHEKSSRLQESMRMMGLIDIAYWLGYFISDGVILGFIVSFTCAILSTGGLFNDANFGVVLGMLFVFCLSAVPFAFFISAFFDTPQTSGQATLAVLVGTCIMINLQPNVTR